MSCFSKGNQKFFLRIKYCSLLKEYFNNTILANIQPPSHDQSDGLKSTPSNIFSGSKISLSGYTKV
jgi:hypothetical protein